MGETCIRTQSKKQTISAGQRRILPRPGAERLRTRSQRKTQSAGWASTGERCKKGEAFSGIQTLHAEVTPSAHHPSSLHRGPSHSAVGAVKQDAACWAHTVWIIPTHPREVFSQPTAETFYISCRVLFAFVYRSDVFTFFDWFIVWTVSMIKHYICVSNGTRCVFYSASTFQDVSLNNDSSGSRVITRCDGEDGGQSSFL